MKIIFDCTVLNLWVGQPTGIQRVVKELGLALSEISHQVLTAIFDKEGNCFSYCPILKKVSSEIRLIENDMIFCTGHDWDYPEHFKIICDIVKNKSLKLVTLLHDTIPLKFPFTYSDDFVARFKSWFCTALELSSVCFSVSENTRSDVIYYADLYNIKAPNIYVSRLGDNIPKQNSLISEKVAELVSVKYILSVGTIEYRKNHIILLNAYRYIIGHLKLKPPKLYIVGRNGYLDSHINIQVSGDEILKNNIEIISNLSDDELGVLYSSALFTLYPSIYEGWGLPVAESLSYGVPCITSNTSSMLEIAPQLTKFANPYMTNEWVEHILEWILNDNVLLEHKAMTEKSYTPVKWSDTASFVLERLINSSGLAT